MKIDKYTKIFLGIKKRLKILSILSIVGLLIGQLGQIYWVFDLFSHFTWLYLLGCFGGLIVFRLWEIKSFFALVILYIFFISMKPFAIPVSKMNMPQKSLRLVTYNLDFNHSSKREELVLLEDELSNPNLLFFVSEYDSEWHEVFIDKYSHLFQCGKVEDSPFGLALYSPLNFDSCEIKYPIEGLEQYPYVRAEHEGFVIYGIHPPPPINPELARIRDQSLENIALMISKEHKTPIVMGDFNISPYSPIFQKFLSIARINDTKNKLVPTWLLGLINIDHILVRELEFSDEEGASTKCWGGSDHRLLSLNYKFY